MDNFDLRKYLAENKLTNQSKLISEEFLFINSDGEKVYKDEKGLYYIEKNPFKKFLVLLFIGLPLLFFIDLGLGFILILISFIYGIFLVKGKLKILAIGIILNISTGLLFYDYLSMGISFGEAIERTFFYINESEWVRLI